MHTMKYTVDKKETQQGLASGIRKGWYSIPSDDSNSTHFCHYY